MTDIDALIARLDTEYPGAEYHHPSVYEAAAALREMQARIAELAAERECLILDYQKEYARANRAIKAEAERDALRELLREWRNAPFFDDELSWRKWVDEFGPRVDAAIAAKEKP